MKYLSFNGIVLSVVLVTSSVVVGMEESSEFHFDSEPTPFVIKIMQKLGWERTSAEGIAQNLLEKEKLSGEQAMFVVDLLAASSNNPIHSDELPGTIERVKMIFEQAALRKMTPDSYAMMDIYFQHLQLDPISMPDDQFNVYADRILGPRRKAPAETHSKRAANTSTNVQTSPVNVGSETVKESVIDLASRIEKGLKYDSKKANELAVRLNKEQGDRAFFIVDELTEIANAGVTVDDKTINYTLDFANGIFDQARRRGITVHRYRAIFRYAEKNCERGFDLTKLDSEAFKSFAEKVPQASRSNSWDFDIKNIGLKEHLSKRWYLYVGGAVVAATIVGVLIYYFKTNKKEPKST